MNKKEEEKPFLADVRDFIKAIDKVPQRMKHVKKNSSSPCPPIHISYTHIYTYIYNFVFR